MAKDYNPWPNKSREVSSAKEQRLVYSEHDWREGKTFKYRIIVRSVTYTGEASSASEAKKNAEKKAKDAGVNLEFIRLNQNVGKEKVMQLS